MMKVIYLYMIIFLISGCSSQSISVNKVDGRTISYILDKLASPLIPPPAIDYDTTEVIPQKFIDSLKDVKLRLWIHPKMDELSKGYLVKYLPSNVLSKFDKRDLETIIITNLDNISSITGHSLVIADTVSLKQTIDFSEADQLFNFSRIIYSSIKQDEALIEVGVSHSGLAGFSMIYYLRQENGEWYINNSYEVATW